MAVGRKQLLNRLYLVTGCTFLLAVAIFAKLIDIQWVEGEKYNALAAMYTVRNFEIPANRGNVYSVNGDLLAASIPKYEIRMDAVTVAQKKFEKNIGKLADSLAAMFGKTSGYYEKYIRKGRKDKNRYLFIARNLGYYEYMRLKQFPIFDAGMYEGGFIAEQHTVREHPIGKITERTIGYKDYRGKVGIEGAYDQYLRGQKGRRLKQKISKGQWKPLNDTNETEPRDGLDLYTTIDVAIQDVSHHALLEQLEKFEADHGCAVVMEVKTGEVKAISNLGRTSRGTYYEQRNFAVYESHEPGSTFKLMSVVAALEDHVIDTTYIVDTGNGVMDFYGKKIRESYRGGYGKISVAKAFEISSNVGIVKMIYQKYKNNPSKFADRLYNMGLNDKLGLAIKGEGVPKIPHPDDADWNGLSLPWMAYGYGLSLTPLQILCFYNAIANNGEMVRPRFVKEIRTQDNKILRKYGKDVLNPSICSRETIKKVKTMMENVVKRGTARNIYSPYFSMAGKTGTCQTNYWNGDTQYIASFVGYFPAEKPVYSCIVVIHKPKKTLGYYGADVAAPVFKKIAHKIYVKTPKVKEIEKYNPRYAFPVTDFEKYYKLSQKKYKTMPDLKGMPGMDAISILENMGLKVKFKGNGSVKKQSVKAGHKISKKTTIVLELT